jgi:hypothetical protein
VTWLTPILGAVAAAIAVPSLVILYFLKLRRRDVEISSTFLWKKAIQDLQANAPFQKLRRNLLLFLQLLVLGAVCIALAQPQIKGQTVSGNKHVILIDRSGSMTALDEPDGRGGEQPRLDSAKRQAVAFVESLREGGLLSGKESSDEAMVISFDSAAEVRQQFTSDKSLLKAAILAITPTEGPTRVEEAFRLAEAHKPKRLVENVGLTGGPPVTIHLYSDGQIPDAVKAKPGPEDFFEFHKIGKPDSPNVAIVGLRAAREYDNPSKLTVYVSMENNRPEPRSVDVDLLIDGTSALIKGTTIAGASSEGPRLSAPQAARAGSQESAAAAAVGADADATTVARSGSLREESRSNWTWRRAPCFRCGCGSPVRGSRWRTTCCRWTIGHSWWCRPRRNLRSLCSPPKRTPGSIWLWAACRCRAWSRSSPPALKSGRSKGDWASLT